LVTSIVFAAASAAATPITVHDAFGREVKLPAAPQRVVPIFASNVEMVAALGLADRIVGIEAYTRYPPEVLGRPLVGGRLGFSVDAIVNTRPDLVILTPARQAMFQLVDPMQRLGIPVIVVLSRTVNEVLANLRLFGQAMGVPDRGEQVAAALAARIGKVRASVVGKQEPRVVMITGLVGNGLVLVTRPDTYTGDAVRLAGGDFALGGTATIPQVSPEAILAADPDILLFAGSQKALDDLVSQSGWRDLRAVRTKRVFAVPRYELLIPGPRTIDGIERLARLFHPDEKAR
jgi:iron complex transport system substrate-binding protein